MEGKTLWMGEGRTKTPPTKHKIKKTKNQKKINTQKQLAEKGTLGRKDELSFRHRDPNSMDQKSHLWYFGLDFTSLENL